MRRFTVGVVACSYTLVIPTTIGVFVALGSCGGVIDLVVVALMLFTLVVFYIKCSIFGSAL